jgi:alpha-beta hydrolase superfamily lysophospholipase
MDARRGWSIAGLSGTTALVAAVGGATWYYASRLTDAPADLAEPPPEPKDVVTVAAVEDDRIVLRGPEADRPGHWGLDARGGYVLLHPDHHVTEDGAVSRAFEPRAGLPEAGDEALLDGYAWPPDGTTLTPPAVEVTYATPLGDAPAWFVPGDRDTWIIGVHGRAARRHEAFRLASVAAPLGFPTLAISYRNDADGPRSPDGRSHLGATEWEDVDAAITYARGAGARDVVLVGFSMGGACVVACTRRSDQADHVRGLILEAPVLDWGPVVRRAAIDRGLPASVLPALLPATMALARARVGIDWSQLRSDPAALAHPTLLIHGSADSTVPVELSDAFAEARPDVVRYLRVEGAEHVRSWNHDRGAYERAVTTFLADVCS